MRLPFLCLSIRQPWASAGCRLANGDLTTEWLTEIEIGESACRFPRSSILRICKTCRRKLAKRPKA